MLEAGPAVFKSSSRHAALHATERDSPVLPAPTSTPSRARLQINNSARLRFPGFLFTMCQKQELLPPVPLKGSHNLRSPDLGCQPGPVLVPIGPAPASPARGRRRELCRTLLVLCRRQEPPRSLGMSRSRPINLVNKCLFANLASSCACWWLFFY